MTTPPQLQLFIIGMEILVDSVLEETLALLDRLDSDNATTVFPWAVDKILTAAATATAAVTVMPDRSRKM